MRVRAYASLIAIAALLGACAPTPKPSALPAPPKPEKPSKIALRAIALDALPGWQDDHHGEALVAFQKSCARILIRPKDRDLAANAQAPGGKVAQWQVPCRVAMGLDTADRLAARRFFESWFVAYEVRENGGSVEGLFTGYFEPELNGALEQSGVYQTPLYARPADLVSVSLGTFEAELGGTTIWGRVENGRLQPYPSRAAIDDGQVLGLEPLVWVEDPVEAFFLHVQGSGRVRLEDGSVMRLGFAGKNGRTYKSIGRVLIDSGEIPADRLTMDSIRNWVLERPKQGAELLKKNPSYVFFRKLEGDGPLGAQGVALTAERSLAVDRRYLPLGAPMWLSTHESLNAQKPYNRMMIAQDTGGAIKGVVRGDIFYGAGEVARARAGNMKRPGRYYLLLPRTVVPTHGGR